MLMAILPARPGGVVLRTPRTRRARRALAQELASCQRSAALCLRVACRSKLHCARLLPYALEHQAAAALLRADLRSLSSAEVPYV